MRFKGPAIVVYFLIFLFSQFGYIAAARAQAYGAAVGGDGLANTRLGPQGCMISYRFRAKHSGYLDQIRVYLIPDKAGYAAGTGGTIRVTLNTDDGSSAHDPSSSVLATHWITNILSLPSPSRYFYVVKFANTPWITAGRLYHLVFKNADAYPTVNYLSVDDLYHTVPTTPSQSTVSDTNLAVLLSAAMDVLVSLARSDTGMNAATVGNVGVWHSSQ